MELVAGIINYRTTDDVLACVQSLRRSERPPDRVLVADNASVEAEARRLRVAVGDANVLASPSNRGYAGGANAILRESRDAEFTLLLNPDVRVGSRFCLELLRAAEANPRAGVLGGKLVRPDGRTLDSTGVVARRNGRNEDRGSGTADDGRFDGPEEMFGATGAAILLRGKAMEEIRIGDEYFDEDFFLYHEDNDLCWRVLLAGWKALYVPSAVAEHTRAYRQGGRERMSRSVRGHAFKNHYLKLVKNLLPAQFARDALHLLGWEAVRLGYATLREPFLWGYALNALRLLPRALRKRREIMSRRRAGWRELSRWFV
jgi:GT2 family glycosyltransferase